MRHCKVLEIGAPRLPLWQNKADTTLEEVRQIYGFSKIMGLPIFMRSDRYIAVLSQLTGLSTQGCQQRLICTSGPMPMLRLAYFDETVEKHAELGDELWL